jgi:hypothetical protein
MGIGIDLLLRNPIRRRPNPEYLMGMKILMTISQFEIVADLNNWDYRTKSLQLAGHLAKDACGLLGELSPDQRRDYDTLVNALKIRFGSTERSEMFRAKLKTWVKGRDESISELAQAIKKLTRQAYPSAEPGLTNILALDQFIDALPDPDIRLRLREARPRDISEAETLAIRLETYRIADSQKCGQHHSINSVASKGNDSQGSLVTLLEKLNENIVRLEKATTGQNPSPNHQKGNWENWKSRDYDRDHKWKSQKPKSKGSWQKRENGSNYTHKAQSGKTFDQGSTRENTAQGDQRGNYPVSTSQVGNR